MAKNLGSADRILRSLAAAMMVAGFFLAPLGLGPRLGMLMMGLYLAFTAFSSTCLCYRMMGMSTCPLPKH